MFKYTLHILQGLQITNYYTVGCTHKTNFYKKCISNAGILYYNLVPSDRIKNAVSLYTFKNSLKNGLHKAQ